MDMSNFKLQPFYTQHRQLYHCIGGIVGLEISLDVFGGIFFIYNGMNIDCLSLTYGNNKSKKLKLP